MSLFDVAMSTLTNQIHQRWARSSLAQNSRMCAQHNDTARVNLAERAIRRSGSTQLRSSGSVAIACPGAANFAVEGNAGNNLAPPHQKSNRM